MDIKDCNEYRIRMMQAIPRTCKVCGLGPCRYLSGENNWSIHAVGTTTERIEAGQLVKIVQDPVTGITYARKA